MLLLPDLRPPQNHMDPQGRNSDAPPCPVQGLPQRRPERLYGTLDLPGVPLGQLKLWFGGRLRFRLLRRSRFRLRIFLFRRVKADGPRSDPQGHGQNSLAQHCPDSNPQHPDTGQQGQQHDPKATITATASTSLRTAGAITFGMPRLPLSHRLPPDLNR